MHETITFLFRRPGNSKARVSQRGGLEGGPVSEGTPLDISNALYQLLYAASPTSGELTCRHVYTQDFDVSRQP